MEKMSLLKLFNPIKICFNKEKELSPKENLLNYLNCIYDLFIFYII